MKTIGMLGMGKLGLPCLMAMEAKGYKVIGTDPDPWIPPPELGGNCRIFCAPLLLK